MNAMESLIDSTEDPAPPSIIERLAPAQNPDTDSRGLWLLIDDPNDTVANTARHRLNLAFRPLKGLHIPLIDRKTGLVAKP